MDETLPYNDYEHDHEDKSSSSFSSYSMSSTNDTYHPISTVLGPESVIVPLILVFIALFAIAGNSLVIFIVLRYRKMRQSVTNFYIMNVAVGDLVYMLACAPLTAVLYAEYEWKLGNFLCKFNAFLQHVTVQATCATLTVMTVDRYYVITNPFTSRQTRTILRAGAVCCIVWIVSGLMHVPSALIYGTTKPGEFYFNREPVIFCTSTHLSKRFIRFNSMYVIAVTYVIPLAIISVCYGLILAHLWKLSKGGITATSGKAAHRSKGQSTSLTEGSSVQTATKKWKTTRIVLIVVMLFAICWAPIHAINLWNDVDPNYPHDAKSIYAFRMFALLLAYSNSCVNPVVYALAGNSFQVYFRQICHSRPRGKQEVASTKTNYTSMQRHGRRTSNSQTEQISMTANTSV